MGGDSSLESKGNIKRIIEKEEFFLKDSDIDVSKHLIEGFAKEVDEKINRQLFKELIEKYNEAMEELQEKVEIIEQLSMTDTLTGIYNRKKFLKEFELELKRCQRKNRNLTLAILDIDHFKKVNDTYGHETGDSVLVEFCEVVKANIREVDIFARWGGEEFVIVLGDTSKKDSLFVLERIRKGIESFEFTKAGKITCSMGTTDIEETLPEDMFTRADEALYTAKKTGRNKVIAWKKA